MNSVLVGSIDAVTRRRHVPVIDAQSKPTGVMEARDALRALMADASYEISWLRDYIMGVGYR